MQVGAGGEAGLAEIADDLALAHPHAGLDALGEGALVVIGGLVAVGVADDDLLAVAARPARLLDDAIAGGDDRGAHRGRPVDAGVHAHIAQYGVPAGAEAGAEGAGRQRVAQQELLGAAAVLVEIVGRPVLHLEAVERARGRPDAGRDIEKLRIVRSLVAAVGLGEQHFEPVGRIEPGLEVDVGGQQPDQLPGHVLRHAVGIGRAVDAVIDVGQAAAHRHGRRIVESGQKLGVRLRLLGRHILAAIVQRDRHDVLGLVVDAGAHHARPVAMHLEPDAQHGAGLEGGGVEQLADRLGHAGGVRAVIARIGEGLGDVAVLGEGDDLLGEGGGLVLRVGARRHGDVLRHDPHVVGAGDGLGELVAEPLRVHIVQRRHLNGAVVQLGAGLAHHILHLVGGQVALLVEGGGLHGKVHGLEAHLALDLGAVDLAGGRRRCGVGAVVAEHLKRVEGRIGAAGGMAGRQCHPDLHERHDMDDVAVADLGDHRHLHAAPVLGLGDLAQRHQALGLGPLARFVARGQAGQLGDLGRGGKLLAPVERGEQGNAHQHAGGYARQKGARQPPRGNLAAVRRPAAPVRDQRRLVAETGYDLFGVLHPGRLLFPQAGFLLGKATTFARHGR